MPLLVWNSKHKGAVIDAKIDYVNDTLPNDLNAKVPKTTTINGKPLTANVTLNADNIVETAGRQFTTPAEKTGWDNKEEGGAVNTHNTSEIAHSDLLDNKVDKEFKTDSETEYKVLSDNNLTDGLTEKLNNLDLIKIDTVQIYPVTFCDIDENGDIIYREDGSGDYLITRKQNLDIIAKPINIFTDDVTGKKYNITISNGKMILKEVV